MNCPLTDEPAAVVFEASVLGKYPVRYYRSPKTGFIFTDPPHWLDEAYSSAIARTDVGLVARNLELAEFARRSLAAADVTGQTCLDYGGGYGLFVRLMRDRGYDFRRHDPLCENLFAAGFDAALEDAPNGRYAAVTAFEVLEHLPDPLATLRPVAERCDTLICSTELQPTGKPLSGPDDWWYFMPETGQHVSFYTVAALEVLAAEFGMTLATDGRSRHIFSRRPVPPEVFGAVRAPRSRPMRRAIRAARRLLNRAEPSAADFGRRESLLQADYQSALSEVRRAQSSATGHE